MKNHNVTKEIFGFVLESKDITKLKLEYKKNINIDKAFKVPVLKKTSNSTEVAIMIDHDFTERYYEFHFFGWMDILSSIGGYNASIGPMLNVFVPLLTMNFLF